MRILVLAIGSRGDVEPFVALARRLVLAGHEVRLASHEEFRDLAGRHGLDLAELPGNPRELLNSPTGQAMLRARTPIGVTRGLRRLVAPTIEETYPYAERAAAGADVVVFSSLALVGMNVADRLGVPSISAHLQPSQPTAEFPTPTLPTERRLPRVANRASWRLSETVLWRAFVPVLNAQRRQLSLPDLPTTIPSRWPAGQRPIGLFGYSPSVLPVPADWPSSIHVTGYWFNEPPTGWLPPTPVVDFLAAGDAPVYLGFGSMSSGDPEQVSRALVEAARRLGRRSVLSSGWAGLSVAGAPDVLPVGDLPHAWLFPRMAAVVHHGGAGTTAAALRAGRPSVIVPHFADQFFWARQLLALGAAPPPVRPAALTVDVLTDRLAEALQPRTGYAAQRVSERLSREDGLSAAVAVIEGAAGGGPG